MNLINLINNKDTKKGISLAKIIIAGIMVSLIVIIPKVYVSSREKVNNFDFSAVNAEEKLKEFKEGSPERKYLETKKEYLEVKEYIESH